MTLELTDHYFLTDGGSVAATVQDQNGARYELFADFPVESRANGALSIALDGHEVDGEQRERLIVAVEQMLKDDWQFRISADGRAVLKKILLAAGKGDQSNDELSADHAMLTDEDREDFGALLDVGDNRHGQPD